MVLMKSVRVVLLLLISTLCPAVIHAAADGPQTTFYRANSLYAEGRYAEAAEAYEQLAASGYDGGNLRFNLANAHFKLGDLGSAVLNFERAERWIPGDPDLDANLAFARSLTGAEVCQAPLWTRTLFPFATRSSAWALALWASALLTLIFGALAVGRLVDAKGRGFSLAVVALGLALFAVSASLVYRVSQIDIPDRAVVIASGETAVRFEPAVDGTAHYVVPQGTSVRVSDLRDGWTLVSRCDGRRGWIESRAIATL